MEVVTEKNVVEKKSGKTVKLITKNILDPEYGEISVKEEYLDFHDDSPRN